MHIFSEAFEPKQMRFSSEGGSAAPKGPAVAGPRPTPHSGPKLPRALSGSVGNAFGNRVPRAHRMRTSYLKHLSLFFAMICLLCGGARIASAIDDSTFAKANQDYNDGRFQNAVDGYQSIIKSGHWSANLFYNLGNAWFRLDNFGEAILNYERALALDPHHPEAGANLILVRDEARALELRKSKSEHYIDALTSTQYAIAASIAFWCLLFAIARLIFVRRRSSILIAFVIIAALISTGAVFSLYSLETGTKGRALAIVTGKKIEARLATADNANSVLALPPGSEIKIVSQRGDWLYAELPNDLRGWIPANAAERVRM